MEVLEAVLDEVALEGLDGITVPALWLRLQDRVPPFPLVLDAATKQFIWRSLVCHPELHFYVLPTERRPLVISNRYEEEEFDLGTIRAVEGLPEDPYPFHPVTDQKGGNQGSCQYFHERILVTELLQTQSVTCDAAIDRWGEKLVIAGSQTLRYRTLIGWEADPSLELPDSSYCILEKVGRSRWQGEIQKDLQGIFKYVTLFPPMLLTVESPKTPILCVTVDMSAMGFLVYVLHNHFMQSIHFVQNY
ncbi:unnamed protein product [Ranitomeya imitator]|uniref:Uncharacterized protein n=1 Tax=Ranitomeya imitator TaxID=111125 RepID=A0ABN9LZQ1_9NEOB|nr:unnamed protein product [Ranitomeya imitator]